jgi:predicted DNA binding protein
MYEATFHVRGDVAYEDATAGRDVTIELWCNEHCDLLSVHGDTDGAVRADVDDAVGVADALDRGDEHVLVTDECLRAHTDGNVEAYLRAHDCLLLPPLRYADGGKIVRVLTLDAANLTAFYDAIRADADVTVRAKREIASVPRDRPLHSLSSLLPTLTARQEAAITTAWNDGYYDIPRETTTADLADGMGVDRRTFEEHLRIAERKLVGTLVDERYD